MCGRYATTRGATDLSALFESVDDTGGEFAADYNIAPTDPVPIVRLSDRLGGRALSMARWGLVPSWARDTRGAARMINARAETVATSNAFAKSFAQRRCLLPADGWYEWVRSDPATTARNAKATKQPYFMTRHDGDVLAFAGVWSVWGNATETLLTCSIITMSAVGDLALVHDRMPLLLPPERWSGWLNGDAALNGDAGDPAALLAPPSEAWLAGLEIRPVGRAVGDVNNDGPELVARISAPPLGAPPEEPAPLTLF